MCVIYVQLKSSTCVGLSASDWGNLSASTLFTLSLCYMVQIQFFLTLGSWATIVCHVSNLFPFIFYATCCFHQWRHRTHCSTNTWTYEQFLYAMSSNFWLSKKLFKLKYFSHLTMSNYTLKLCPNICRRAFLKQHYPWFLPTYDGYTQEMMRIDAIRYFLMFHYGGIYLDIDMSCKVSPNPSLYICVSRFENVIHDKKLNFRRRSMTF